MHYVVVSSISTVGNFIFLLKVFQTLDINFIQKSHKCEIGVLNEKTSNVFKGAMAVIGWTKLSCHVLVIANLN